MNERRAKRLEALFGDADAILWYWGSIPCIAIKRSGQWRLISGNVERVFGSLDVLDAFRQIPDANALPMRPPLKWWESATRAEGGGEK